jgi:hypothetical protein
VPDWWPPERAPPAGGVTAAGRQVGLAGRYTHPRPVAHQGLRVGGTPDPQLRAVSPGSAASSGTPARVKKLPVMLKQNICKLNRNKSDACLMLKLIKLNFKLNYKLVLAFSTLK